MDLLFRHTVRAVFFATGLIFGFNTTAPTQELKLIYSGTPTRSGQAYNAIGDMWPSDGTASEQGLRNAIAVAEIAPSMSHEQLLSWTLLKETLAAFKNEFQPR